MKKPLQLQAGRRNVPAINPEMARATLGCLLIDNSYLPQVAQFLQPEDFDEPKDRTLYTTMLMLLEETGEPPDIVQLDEFLRDRGLLASVGGPTFTSYYTNGHGDRFTSLRTLEYAHTVFELALKHQTDLVGQSLAARGITDAEAERRLADIRERRESENLRNGELREIRRIGDENENSHNSRNSRNSPFSLPGYPEKLADIAYHGVAGDYVRTVAEHTEASPEGILVQFLVAFGNAIGRSAYFPVSHADRHFANEYICLVGPTSSRKGVGWRLVEDLFERVEPIWACERVRSGLSSGEGVIEAVRDAAEGEPAAEKRLLALETEFASVLKVISREGNTLSAILRNAWDRGHIATLTRNPVTASDAHISIVGHITQQELVKLLTSIDAGNGFGNRFLWVAVQRARYLPEGSDIEDQAFQRIVQRLHDAIEHGKTRIQGVKRDEAARKLWAECYRALSSSRPGMLGAMTARAEAHVMRLALIYALLDKADAIGEPHLKAALEVWRYCQDSARFIFGASVKNDAADRIYEALSKATSGLTRTEISRIFNNHKKPDELDSALGLLEANGLVRHLEEKPNPTSIKATKRYFAEGVKAPSDTQSTVEPGGDAA